ERAGMHPEQVPGFRIGDGLGLLLERGPVLRAITTRAIRTLVPNSLSLVLALGQAHHQGKAHSMGKKYGKQALLLPSIFGQRLVKFFLGELGRISAQLKDIELPPTCGDAEKAEMLLGYLARTEKDKDSEPKSSTSEGASA